MDPRNQPRLTAPVQAPPVYRDEQTEQAARTTAPGVQSSASACANLTGPARQMCYLQKYGLTT
jgi:hypothetical protein